MSQDLILQAMHKRLIVFDFDGTLTHGDSMLAFTRFYHGLPRFILGLFYLSPQLLAYKVGLLPNWRAKEYYLTHFFGGEPLTDFQQTCDRFARERIPLMLRSAAKHRLREYLQAHDRILIVSSSAENWLRAWCEEQSVELIATRLQSRNGRLTGKLEGKNCYGPEKVKRLRAHLPLSEYDEVIAYGDSKGDRELLEMASVRFFKPFRKQNKAKSEVIRSIL